MHTIPFPSSDPKQVGPLAAARAGNVVALRIAADRLRDADRDADARKLDLLAGEFQSRCVQAHHLRDLLRASDLPPREPTSWDDGPQMREVRAFINTRGLPLEAFAIMTCKGMPCGFVILMPTDGQEVEETANRLGEFLGSAFPGATFFIYAINRPISAAGWEAESLCASWEGEPQRAAA
jgi:hypothetical protein